MYLSDMLTNLLRLLDFPEATGHHCIGGLGSHLWEMVMVMLPSPGAGESQCDEVRTGSVTPSNGSFGNSLRGNVLCLQCVVCPAL